MYGESFFAYTYDNADNILTGNSHTYTCGDSDWGDLLTAYDGVPITHDEIGNPLNDGTWEYIWEHGRELATMSSGSTTWSYTYNADGLRTSRSNGTTTYEYVYNGGSLVQMTVGNDVLYFAYDASGTPMSVTYNGTVYYYATNLQGDVTAILNTSGTAVVEYTYDAWGKILTTTGTMAETLGAVNPLRYRGYVYDRESTLYYLQSRYYDPELGRFINADAYVSTGQGLLGNNMFAYCGNDPIDYSDPSGHKRVFWYVLFHDHRPGYIHEMVQAHILLIYNAQAILFSKEYVVPGVGRADICKPSTGEVWEIKHGGSSLDSEVKSYRNALDQLEKYLRGPLSLRAGGEGEFTGTFIINYGDRSYEVFYDTPGEGVILYYLTPIERTKNPDYVYESSTVCASAPIRNMAYAYAMLPMMFMGSSYGAEFANKDFAY